MEVVAVVLVDGNIAKSPHANWATSVSSQKALMVLTNVLIVVRHFREIRFVWLFGLSKFRFETSKTVACNL